MATHDISHGRPDLCVVAHKTSRVDVRVYHLEAHNISWPYTHVQWSPKDFVAVRMIMWAPTKPSRMGTQ